MKIANALKLKNQLAGDVAQLKELLVKQNSRSTKQKFDYDISTGWCSQSAPLAEAQKVSV
jgi:hypothetical protein